MANPDSLQEKCSPKNQVSDTYLTLSITYEDIRRDYWEPVPKTDLPHLFNIRIVQHCASFLAIAVAQFLIFLNHAIMLMQPLQWQVCVHISGMCVNVDVGVQSNENVSQVLRDAGSWCLVLDGLPLPWSQRDQQPSTAIYQATECQHYRTSTNTCAR